MKEQELMHVYPETPQEVFDIVTKHLLTQNERAADDIMRCRYRGNNGTSCAIGCLIADVHYKDAYEDKGLYSLLDSSLLPDNLYAFLYKHRQSASVIAKDT